MTGSDISISDSDIFICEAFKEILANSPAETDRMLTNEGRDICQFIQTWATEELNQNNQGERTQVQPQGERGNKNASN